MNSAILEAALKVFQYPTTPFQRRHGPRGYTNYRLYKPWLRDEFCFRCVYCLCRERWEPNGQDVFSIEHLAPRVTSPELSAEYDNLLYACSICNACRQEASLPFDPCAEAMAMHLQTRANGAIEGLTLEGRNLCDLCHLNRPLLVQFRRYLLELMELLLKRQGPEDERVLRRVLGFPADLPNLRSKRPPGSNSRPEGISNSCYERRKRKELPVVY